MENLTWHQTLTSLLLLSYSGPNKKCRRQADVAIENIRATVNGLEEDYLQALVTSSKILDDLDLLDCPFPMSHRDAFQVRLHEIVTQAPIPIEIALEDSES